MNKTHDGQRIGYYLPKADRVQRANDVRDTHFTMGMQSHEQKMLGFQTTSKNHYMSPNTQNSPHKAANDNSPQRNFNIKQPLSVTQGKATFQLKHDRAQNNGYVSTAKRYHNEGTIFGGPNMDLKSYVNEKKEVKNQKEYLQQSHIHMSMRRYDDHFMSTNKVQQERNHQSAQRSPNGRSQEKLKTVVGKSPNTQKMSSNLPLDQSGKGYMDYKNIQTSMQQEYKMHSPQQHSATLNRNDSGGHIQEQINFKLNYRNEANRFHPAENQFSQKNYQKNLNQSAIMKDNSSIDRSPQPAKPAVKKSQKNASSIQMNPKRGLSNNQPLFKEAQNNEQFKNNFSQLAKIYRGNKEVDKQSNVQIHTQHPPNFQGFDLPQISKYDDHSKLGQIAMKIPTKGNKRGESSIKLSSFQTSAYDPKNINQFAIKTATMMRNYEEAHSQSNHLRNLYRESSMAKYEKKNSSLEKMKTIQQAHTLQNIPFYGDYVQINKRVSESKDEYAYVKLSKPVGASAGQIQVSSDAMMNYSQQKLLDKDPKQYLLNKGRAQHFSYMKQKNQGSVIGHGGGNQYDQFGKIRQSFGKTTMGFNRNLNKTIDAASNFKKQAIFDNMEPRSIEIGSLTQDTGRFAHNDKQPRAKPETALNILRSSTTQNSQVKIDTRSRSINVNTNPVFQNANTEKPTMRNANNMDGVLGLNTDRRKTSKNPPIHQTSNQQYLTWIQPLEGKS